MSGQILTTLLLCGLMGLIGQGVRAVVGLKNAAATESTDPTVQSSFNAAYLFISLMIGFIAGVLAGIGIGLTTVDAVKPDDLKLLLGVAAAGYAGTDFIENTFSKIIPGAGGDTKVGPIAGSTATSNSILPKVMNINPNAGMTLATHLVGSAQSIISADDVIGMMNDRSTGNVNPTGANTSSGTPHPNAAAATSAGTSSGSSTSPIITQSSNSASADWTSTELLRDMDEASKYKPFIVAAAEKDGLPPSLICAVGSRESNWGLSPEMKPKGPAGTGDWAKRKGAMPPDGLGWGRGLMQADYAASDFAKDPTKWKDPQLNINFGCEELAANIVHFTTKYPALSQYDVLRAAVAAYNTGPGNVEKSLAKGHDVDSTTTGGDYSKDVLLRAAWFKAHNFDSPTA